MLYWGLFTSGFIVGTMITLFVLGYKDQNKANGVVEQSYFKVKDGQIDPNTLFDQLTQINYFPVKNNFTNLLKSSSFLSFKNIFRRA